MTDAHGRIGDSAGTTSVTRAILRRRTVRDGLLRNEIPEAVVREIVLCGLSGPASKAAIPLRFHVVTDTTILDRIAEVTAGHPDADHWVPRRPGDDPASPRWQSSVAESADVLRQASVGIVVEDVGPFTGGPSIWAAADPFVRTGSMFARTLEVAGIGAAVQSMLLAADALGLAGAFMGDPVVAESEICELLGVRASLAGVLALGWPTARPSPHDRTLWLDEPGLVEWYRPASNSHRR